MGWRRNASGWQVVRWTARSHLVSRARQPNLHGDHRGGARWQRLVPPPAQHRSRLVDGDVRLGPDARLERPSGRLGRRCGRRWTRRSVRRSAGRTAQSPLPQSRRLDVRGHHGQAGVGVLDDTAQSLFVDVDNDGDQDLVVATSTNPLLFINDGKGHFTPVPDAFRFARPLQGVLTSITMADYDRDGFLDLYLCVYSYFFGAGEDKAGTPAPYYDARNGPPGVLFRNDGRGRFVDATAGRGSRRRKRSLSFRGGLGRLRRRRLAGSPGRERLRDQEPVSQPRAPGRQRDDSRMSPHQREFSITAPA